MKITPPYREHIIKIVCYLYILLFVYAASSKLLDFVNFKVQIGQSPLLNAFAEVVAIAVPLFELAIAGLLFFPRLRIFGLYSSFSLMVMFSVYIYLILNYSYMVPCSCGGILEKMGWQEHLLFNLVFVLLAATAIFLRTSSITALSATKVIKRKVISLGIILMLSTALVVGLYLLSNNITHYSNTFIRRFPHFPAEKVRTADLKYNSFYIAGCSENGVYLGSTTAQLIVTELDTTLKVTKEHHIHLDRKNLPFRALTIRVDPPYFYVFDGAVPCIYKGTISDWNAKLEKISDQYFTLAEPIDNANIIVRVQKRGNGESLMGRISLSDTATTILNPGLLQKQIDGLFDTDGHLAFSRTLNRFVYLYAYRNQFAVASPDLTVDYRGHTIDTFSHAQIDIVNISTRGVKKLGHTPLVVNKGCTVYNNILFVQSGIAGRYEGNTMWEQASIIDLYDLTDKSYRFSFYIYDEDGKKLKNFVVQNAMLYALIGNRIVLYKLGKQVLKEYKK